MKIMVGDVFHHGFEKIFRFVPLLREADELCHVFDPMNDVDDLSIRSNQGGIDRAPISFFKSASLRFGTANVVFLHCHGVEDLILQHPLQ